MNTKRIYLTKIVIAFGISLLMMLWAISTSAAILPYEKDPYRVEEFSVNTPGDLEVRTSGGHITVEGSNSNRVRVEMFVSKNGRNLSPSDTDLEDFEISIEQDGNSVHAIAKRENSSSWKFWKNNNISISFVVYTPREMSTDQKTSGGHIKATGLNGQQEIATSGGHLELADLQGTIDARTSGGHIDLENIAGTLEASTSGGSISANITEIGEFAELKTSGGNINIIVPKNVGMDLNLRGSHVRTQLDNFSGSMEDDDVEGSINGGGPLLSARTSGGTVHISFN